jgi:RNA polymerase primary sigma factor
MQRYSEYEGDDDVIVIDNEPLYEESDFFASVPTDLEETASDTLRMWLCEVKKIELLTVEEEIELAKKIEQGDKQARKVFIERNLRLVVSLAWRYRGRLSPREKEVLRLKKRGLTPSEIKASEK